MHNHIKIHNKCQCLHNLIKSKCKKRMKMGEKEAQLNDKLIISIWY